MDTVLRSGNVKARKEHRSDADNYFDFCKYRDEPVRVSELKDLNFTDEEIQTVIKERERNFVIDKGEVHYCQVGIGEGEIYDYRASLAIHAICVKYDLYGDY